MPIHACVSCGSDRLRYPKDGQGAYSCDDCSWSGKPREFERYADWRAHRDGLQAKVKAH